MGYGYQIWMCQPKGSYRADGAFGQFTIVIPEKDMIVAITESAHNPIETQNTLNVIWEMLDEIDNDGALAEDTVASAKLADKMERLSLPSPLYAPLSKKIADINNVEYTVNEGRLAFGYELAYILSGLKPAPGISDLVLILISDSCAFAYTQNGEKKQIDVAIDGSRRFNRVYEDGVPTSIALASGAWVSENTFKLTLRWIETCFENKRYFTFTDNRAEVKSEDDFLFGPPNDEIVKATAK